GATLTVSYLGTPEQEHPVRVLGANPDFDLALLEFVDPEGAPTLAPLPLGDSGQVVAGQAAIAIGAPFGLHSSVTSGIVSAIERERPGLVGIEIPFIQTDAAINPGNSGGPLFNSRGEVIGINNAILASPGGRTFVGVGFAVPINLLHESMDGLMAGGLTGVAAAVAELPERPRLGLTARASVEDYPRALQQELDLPDHGLVIENVAPGGPADEAGLTGANRMLLARGQSFPIGGDIIIAAEGQPIHRMIDLQQIVLEHDAGDILTLEVWRDGEVREVAVGLEVVPPG
ncbi:MAG: S1C family serine protease, partial [Wenzhouxiangella sp.]